VTLQRRDALPPNLLQRKEMLLYAKQQILAGEWESVQPDRLAQDLRELDLYGDDIEPAIATGIDEIEPANYNGGYPPHLAHDDDIDGAEMYSFAWNSPSLNCRMYIKFCKFNDTLNLVSFHKERRRLK
jgi:hypothetical protein